MSDVSSQTVTRSILTDCSAVKSAEQLAVRSLPVAPYYVQYRSILRGSGPGLNNREYGERDFCLLHSLRESLLSNNKVPLPVGSSAAIDQYINHLLRGRLLAESRGVWEYVPPLFENMGLVICPNLHRNSEGGVWVGVIENVIEDRLRRD